MRNLAYRVEPQGALTRIGIFVVSFARMSSSSYFYEINALAAFYGLQVPSVRIDLRVESLSHNLHGAMCPCRDR